MLSLDSWNTSLHVLLPVCHRGHPRLSDSCPPCSVQAGATPLSELTTPVTFLVTIDLLCPKDPDHQSCTWQISETQSHPAFACSTFALGRWIYCSNTQTKDGERGQSPYHSGSSLWRVFLMPLASCFISPSISSPSQVQTHRAFLYHLDSKGGQPRINCELAWGHLCLFRRRALLSLPHSRHFPGANVSPVLVSSLNLFA